MTILVVFVSCSMWPKNSLKLQIQLTIIDLSVFEVRLIQAAKFKSSSCPRKKPFHDLWPICQALLASNWFQTYKIFLVSTAMFSCMRGVTKDPSPHAL